MQSSFYSYVNSAASLTNLNGINKKSLEKNAKMEEINGMLSEKLKEKISEENICTLLNSIIK